MTCDYLHTYVHTYVHVYLIRTMAGTLTDYRFIRTISMNVVGCIVHMKLAFNQQNAVCVVLWAGMGSPFLSPAFYQLGVR